MALLVPVRPSIIATDDSTHGQSRAGQGTCLAKVVRDKNMLNCSVAIAFLLSLACYLNSLSGELVHDDIFAVRDNQDLRSSTPIAQLLQDDFWGEPMRSPVSLIGLSPCSHSG